MPQLRPDDLAPLDGQPTLRALTAHLVGAKKNAEARALLGLPEVTLDWDCSEDAE